MAFDVGDTVKVVDREPVQADQKPGLYYAHFRNLSGVVDRVYGDGTICVNVDHATLSKDMLVRLRRAEKVIKPRWKTAEGSDEESSSTSEEDGTVPAVEALVVADTPDQRLKSGLRYAIVVREADVHLLQKGPGPVVAAASEVEAPPARVREADLKAAEKRYMAELSRRAAQAK